MSMVEEENFVNFLRVGEEAETCRRHPTSLSPDNWRDRTVGRAWRNLAGRRRWRGRGEGGRRVGAERRAPQFASWRRRTEERDRS